MGCCVQKLTILDEKLSTQFRFNRMSFTTHWKSRRVEMQKLAEYSQKEEWITHY
jgi:hypothetical protein